jgi:hypothetical protein
VAGSLSGGPGERVSMVFMSPKLNKCAASVPFSRLPTFFWPNVLRSMYFGESVLMNAVVLRVPVSERAVEDDTRERDGDELAVAVFLVGAMLAIHQLNALSVGVLDDMTSRGRSGWRVLVHAIVMCPLWLVRCTSTGRQARSANLAFGCWEPAWSLRTCPSSSADSCWLCAGLAADELSGCISDVDGRESDSEEGG